MSTIKKLVQVMSLSLGIGALISIEASAIQVDMAPGLWEHTIKMSGDAMTAQQQAQSEQMQKAMEKMKEQMANMPADKREMMEKMMDQHGVKMTDKGITTSNMQMQMTKDGTKLKVCVTKEDVERGEIPTRDQEKCTEKYTQVNAKTIKTTFECKGAMESHGEAQITFNDSKSYTGTSTVYTTNDGKTMTMHSEQSGQWLSNDCGDIKPYTHPQTKTK
jgi:ribosome recycling factor